MKSWWELSADMTMAGMEAQRVIALRILKLAAGGPAASKEAHKMISEKIAASVEAAVTLASGGSADSVVRRYRSIIRANGRRLSRRKR